MILPLVSRAEPAIRSARERLVTERLVLSDQTGNGSDGTDYIENGESRLALWLQHRAFATSIDNVADLTPRPPSPFRSARG